MPDDLPGHYFRLRDNGAQVYRVDSENRNRRIEMVQIATVNAKTGEAKPQGDKVLTPADVAAIRDWVGKRQALVAMREVDDILRTVDHLNLTAHWAQAKASPDQLEAVTDALLMAMHDLRSVLVKRKADRLEGRD